MGFLFGGGSQAGTPAPTPIAATPVARMPTANNAVAREAAARKRQDIFGRSGRRSTMYTRKDTEAGTTAYSNSLLGQTG
jgi:hypothetical protein